MSDIKKRMADGLTTVSAAQGSAMASLRYRDYDRAVVGMELAIDMVKLSLIHI